MRLYSELADWFHLLTAPEDYAEEAAEIVRLAEATVDGELRTLLELGSGGGNNASHLKARFDCTLTDVSEEMLALSRSLNPECEHIAGDMRTLRLGRTFDVVLVHDAVVYMTTEDDLRAAFATAFAHTRPGGVALFQPDCTRETLVEKTDCGGHDGDGRSLRYLEWVRDPDPGRFDVRGRLRRCAARAATRRSGSTTITISRACSRMTSGSAGSAPAGSRRGRSSSSSTTAPSA